MAKKRMFSLGVLETDAFMDLPLSSQALYFHLCLRADDDGFIGNPKRITQNIGASIDDLKLLVTKRFVIVFEDGVIVIKHWRMHNAIKSDRYIKTNYTEDLALLKIKENGAYSMSSTPEISDGSQMDHKWSANGEQMAQTGSVDKNSIDIGLVKRSKVEDSNIPSTNNGSFIDNYASQGIFSENLKDEMTVIVDEWNKTGTLPAKKFRLDSERGRNMAARIQENGLNGVLDAMRKVRDSGFCHGDGPKGWVANLDWFLRADNFQKVIEGQFDQAFQPKQKQGKESTVDRIARLRREGAFNE